MEKLGVLVFGKDGCPKCKILNQRLDAMLGSAEWQDFEKVYQDLATEDGLVAFSQAECINPQRVPALVVARRNHERNRYEPLPNPAPGRPDPVCRAAKLYSLMGLQTDYAEGKGILSPEMLTALLAEARQLASAEQAGCGQVRPA